MTDENPFAADAPGTALAKVDDLKAEFVFIPGNMDALLMDIRVQALAEVAGLDISTPKMRKQFKDTANKVVKSRTFIERLRVGYVSAEKKRLATVDAEAKRIKEILQGIEDEVRSPLTQWENTDKARSAALEAIVDEVNAMQPHLFLDIPSLESAIAKVEAVRPETMQEWQVAAQGAKDRTLATLKDALAQRKQAEANAQELERLRAESAAREQRELNANAAKAEYEAMEKRAADEKHRKQIHKEIIAAMILVSPDCAPEEIVEAIAKGLIPHVKIVY